MASQKFDFALIQPPPLDPVSRSPGGGYFDFLAWSFDTAIAADNDRILLKLRMPETEFWLIHQLKCYNANSDAFDNLAITIKRKGREIDLTGGGQWGDWAGAQPTYNLFFSSTGGGGSVTFGIDSASWKQPPYLGPLQEFEMSFYVNEGLGWAANTVTWEMWLTRYHAGKGIPSHEVLDRISSIPMGGWFDR